MAFTVQNDAGTVDGANAYITVLEFQNYHSDRGNTVPTETSAIEIAIIKATDYVDYSYFDEFVGRKESATQSTEWPRLNAITRNGFNVSESLPIDLKNAVAEYALIAVSSDLSPNPTYDATGFDVESTRTRVDVIETQTTYKSNSNTRNVQRKYPRPDAIISNLLTGVGRNTVGLLRS